MDRWPNTINYTPVAETLEAVKDAAWQKVRLSMKGIPTSRKLDVLLAYDSEGIERERRLRVDNYLNALKRGGQLNDDLTIKRE